MVLICSLALCVARADVTLEYALTDSRAGAVNKKMKISVSRFFARVDSSDRPDEFLLFQAGKFFPLYRVNTVRGTYTLLTSSIEQAGPERHADAIVFKPSRKMSEVAGVRCRLVLELEAGTPGIEHCMANKARLGITERESRTLARLFVLARQRGYDWLAATTPDEDFVSVKSRDSRQARTLELLSVSTSPLKPGYLKVPTTYRQVSAPTAPPVPPPLPAQAPGPVDGVRVR